MWQRKSKSIQIDEKIIRFLASTKKKKKIKYKLNRYIYFLATPESIFLTQNKMPILETKEIPMLTFANIKGFTLRFKALPSYSVRS